MHPKVYSTTDIGKLVEQVLQGQPRTTAYNEIDAIEQVVRRAVVDFYPRRLPGNGSYPDREEIELALAYARFRVSGSHAFRIADAALQRSAEPLPMAPVPPAYIEFDLATAPEYAPGRTLRAAYISRGEVGAITFLSDLGRSRTRGNAMTLLLPSVMKDADTSWMSDSRAGDGNEGDPEALMAAMRAQAWFGPTVMDEYADDPLAFSDDPWRKRRPKQNKGQVTSPRLAYISRYNTVLSACDFPDRPWPEAPAAAEVVLRAAALALATGGSYAAPAYLDGDDASQLSRNWMESRDSDRQTLNLREYAWAKGDGEIDTIN